MTNEYGFHIPKYRRRLFRRIERVVKYVAIVSIVLSLGIIVARLFGMW